MNYYSINISEVSLKDYYSLSQYRRSCADKCRLKEDKLRSISAGVLISRGLKEYGIDERNTAYALNEHSKPYFRDYPDIHFNISHSGDMCIACFSDKEIGCDVQLMENVNLRIADRFFSLDEQNYIDMSHDKQKAFYELWTKKESYIKAIGKGLSVPLNSFSVFDITDYRFTHFFQDEYSFALCERI